MGEGRDIFSNSLVETGVLRVADWLVSWLVRLYFCDDLIDGAQQFSVLQVVSGDADGIHKHFCCTGFGCWFFSCYVRCCVK